MEKQTIFNDIDLLRKYLKDNEFLDEDGFLEIVKRGKKKKFSAFEKILLSNEAQESEKELLQNAVSLLNKNNNIASKGLELISTVSKLQQLSILLSGLNLAATCAGFAIMYAKLDKMSKQIDQVKQKLQQGHEVYANYEFNKVISEHRNMLDSRKTKKYYTEEQMRELVDHESNVLKMLIEMFEKDLTVEGDGLIFAIYSLASMFAVSIKIFDELYYFNNKDVVGDDNVWHSSHDSWMEVFDTLSSEKFVKKIQNHCLFELNLSTIEADVYYVSLSDQVKELAEDIKDNQALLRTLDNKDMMEEYSQFIREEVSSEIRDAFKNTDGAMNDENVVKLFEESLKQVTMAA